jgi:hypothetical protein
LVCADGMKFCRAGCITVEVKSGRLSRSMNWVRCLAPLIMSYAFPAGGAYDEVSALEEAAMRLGSALR